MKDKSKKSTYSTTFGVDPTIAIICSPRYGSGNAALRKRLKGGAQSPPHIPTYFLRRRAAAQNANAPIIAATAAGSGTIERFAVIVEMPSSSDMLILPAIPSWSFRVKSSAETLLPSVANDIKSALHPSLSESSIHACKS